MIDGLVGAKAVSTLGLNLRSVAMQTDSAMRAILAVPMRRVMAAMTDRNFISQCGRGMEERYSSAPGDERRHPRGQIPFRPDSVQAEHAARNSHAIRWFPCSGPMDF